MRAGESRNRAAGGARRKISATGCEIEVYGDYGETGAVRQMLERVREPGAGTEFVGFFGRVGLLRTGGTLI